MTCKILVPQLGFKLMSSAVKVKSSNHWTAREFPLFIYLLLLLKKNVFGCTGLSCAHGIFNLCCSLWDLVP